MYEVKPGSDPKYPFVVYCGKRPIAQFVKKEMAEWYASVCNNTKP